MVFGIRYVYARIGRKHGKFEGIRSVSREIVVILASKSATEGTFKCRKIGDQGEYSLLSNIAYPKRSRSAERRIKMT